MVRRAGEKHSGPLLLKSLNWAHLWRPTWLRRCDWDGFIDTVPAPAYAEGVCSTLPALSTLNAFAGLRAPLAPPHWLGWLLALLVPVLALAGCSAPQNDRFGVEIEEAIPASTRYAAALRSAALARVEARAGSDELAAEHFRAAYRQHPSVEFLLAYARSAERGKLYAEAHEALRRALTHGLPAEEQSRVNADIARLQPLIPAGLVRVAVQVAPAGARLELTRQLPGAKVEDPRKAGAARTWDRVVLASGGIYLPAGTYAVYATARGFQSEMQTLQVAREGAELIAVTLAAEEAGPQLAERNRHTSKPPEPQDKLEDKPQPEVQGPVVEFGVKPKDTRSAIHTWGPLGTSALGVVAIGLGGYFGWQVTQQAALANELTGQGLSKDDYQANLDYYKEQARDMRDLTNYSFIGGGVLLAAGTLWWALAPSSSARSAADSSGDRATASAKAPAGAAQAAAAVIRAPQVNVSPSGMALQWTF